MTNDTKRFKRTEALLTAVLIAAFVLFIIYLIAAGNGIIWLKTLSAIITILVCGLCLAYLYVTRLVWRPRAMWITTAAGSIIVCLLFSILLNFPSKL